jgi:hypothetical protein
MRAVTWRMNQGIHDIHGVVALTIPVILGIRAVVGLMTKGIFGIDVLTSVVPLVERRSLAVASTTDPLMPSV